MKGSEYLAAGLAEAWQASSPVIAFTGARSGAAAYKNAYQDVSARFESVTKFSADVDRTERLADLIPQAFREAPSGDPRPVAPVTAYERVGRRERMVVDDLDEIVGTGAGDSARK